VLFGPASQQTIKGESIACNQIVSDDPRVELLISPPPRTWCHTKTKMSSEAPPVAFQMLEKVHHPASCPHRMATGAHRAPFSLADDIGRQREETPYISLLGLLLDLQ
jgi:hypothetical protein